RLSERRSERRCLFECVQYVPYVLTITTNAVRHVWIVSGRLPSRSVFGKWGSCNPIHRNIFIRTRRVGLGNGAIVIHESDITFALMTFESMQCRIEGTFVHLNILHFIVTKIQTHLVMDSESSGAAAEDRDDHDYR